MACVGIVLVTSIAFASFAYGFLTALVFFAGLSALVLLLLHGIWKHRQPEPFDDKLFDRNPRAFEIAFPGVKQQECGNPE
ncbi:MAG TPA: hypothetical protein VFE98_05965 [Candidatus Bathyarchaeia archaeon]|nr:hypothetical protein [Candidatus Bathyarchaeia archaeon]